MLYSEINTTYDNGNFDTYTNYMSNYRKIKALYEASPAFYCDLKSYIYKQPNESNESYASRLRNTSYENHLSNIISSLLNFLLENKINILSQDTNSEELFCELSENINDISKSVIEDLLLYGKVFCQVSFDENINNQYDLDNSLFNIEKLKLNEIINYKIENGIVKEIVIKKEEHINKSILRKKDDKVIHTFHYYYINDNDLAQCDVYKSPPIEVDNAVIISGNTIKMNFRDSKNDSLDMELVESQTFLDNRIPIFAIQTISDLNLGTNLADMSIEVLNRQSKLLICEERSLNSIPVISLDVEDQMFGNSDDEGKSPYKAWLEKGFMAVGGKSKIEYLEMKSTIYESAKTAINEKIDKMYEIAHLGSYSTLKKVNANSGASKELDLTELKFHISSLATIYKQFLNCVIEYILDVKNLDIEFVITGLDQNGKSDNIERVNMALDFMSKIDIQSDTLKKKIQVMIANIIFSESASYEEMNIINNEIYNSKEDLESDNKSEDKLEDNS